MVNDTFPDYPYIIGLIDTYLKFRLIDEIVDTGKSATAYQALQDVGVERVFRVTQAMLHDPDPDVRCRGAEMMLRMNKAAGVPLTLFLLNDPEHGVRSYVCGLLQAFGDARAMHDVLHVLQTDKDGTVRFSAAYTLGFIGNHGILPTLHAIADLSTLR